MNVLSIYFVFIFEVYYTRRFYKLEERRYLVFDSIEILRLNHSESDCLIDFITVFYTKFVRTNTPIKSFHTNHNELCVSLK